MSAEEDLEFNVRAIAAVKMLTVAVDVGEYVYTPEFATRLAELNAACARQARGCAPEPTDGEELEASYA